MLTMLYRVPAMTVLSWSAEVQTLELMNLQTCLAMTKKQASALGETPVFMTVNLSPFG
jgi:hypothetical protein